MIHLAPGTTLRGGTYRITRFISSGGFGCTYEGEHTMLGARVAIKEFFVKDFCNRNRQNSCVEVGTESKVKLADKLRKKFVEEARVLYRFNHPNIVHVSDIFEENGTAYYIMDYIDGESLNGRVQRLGKLSEKEAIGYILQVADALEYVHNQNRLHLDVKPGNIMVGPDNRAILIDFGVSKHYDDETGEDTSTMLGVNTPGYAPYEQVTKSLRTFSPAADIYALGATLYKLLTGITPPNSALLMGGEEKLVPLPLTISENVRNAVYKAMETKRSDRPQTIRDFRALLIGKEDLCLENTILSNSDCVDGKTELEKNITTTFEKKNEKLNKNVVWEFIFSLGVLFFGMYFFFTGSMFFGILTSLIAIIYFAFSKMLALNLKDNILEVYNKRNLKIYRIWKIFFTILVLIIGVSFFSSFSWFIGCVISLISIIYFKGINFLKNIGTALNFTKIVLAVVLFMMLAVFNSHYNQYVDYYYYGSMPSFLYTTIF